MNQIEDKDHKVSRSIKTYNIFQIFTIIFVCFEYIWSVSYGVDLFWQIVKWTKFELVLDKSVLHTHYLPTGLFSKHSSNENQFVGVDTKEYKNKYIT